MHAVDLGAAGPVCLVGPDIAVDVLLETDELEWAAADHSALARGIPLHRRS